MNVHICDEFCLCPVHQTQMWYSQRFDSHACQDPECEYASGFEAALVNKYAAVRSRERRWEGRADGVAWGSARYARRDP